MILDRPDKDLMYKNIHILATELPLSIPLPGPLTKSNMEILFRPNSTFIFVHVSLYYSAGKIAAEACVLPTIFKTGPETSTPSVKGFEN